MELTREVYAGTEQFPQAETFGLCIQIRGSALRVASHMADGREGRRGGAELPKSPVGGAWGSR
jgi:four helix bundle protein